MEELSNYYNLSECSDRKQVIDYLDQLKNDSKIEWSMDDIDLLKISDIDLDDLDIKELLDFFAKNDVIADSYEDDNGSFYDSGDMYNDEDYDDFNDFGFGDNMN